MTSERKHPTCIETTGRAELAAGERSWICGRDCPQEGVGEDAFVTVRVSREMLALLSDGWSPPVRVRIDPLLEDGTTHTMTAMRHEKDCFHCGGTR